MKHSLVDLIDLNFSSFAIKHTKFIDSQQLLSPHPINVMSHQVIVAFPLATSFLQLQLTWCLLRTARQQRVSFRIVLVGVIGGFAPWSFWRLGRKRKYTGTDGEGFVRVESRRAVWHCRECGTNLKLLDLQKWKSTGNGMWRSNERRMRS